MDWAFLAFLLAVCAAAGFLTLYLRQRFGLSNVEASAWVTLGAGLLFPPFFAQGILLAAAATCVSYAGMSSDNWVPTQLRMLPISLVCGIIVYGGQALLPGVGGRLGTFAAFAVLVCVGLRRVVFIVQGLRMNSQETANS